MCSSCSFCQLNSREASKLILLCVGIKRLYLRNLKVGDFASKILKLKLILGPLRNKRQWKRYLCLRHRPQLKSKVPSILKERKFWMQTTDIIFSLFFIILILSLFFVILKNREVVYIFNIYYIMIFYTKIVINLWLVLAVLFSLLAFY